MSENKKENLHDDIKDFGSSEIKNSKGNIHCLTIVGEIEGHSIVPPSTKTTKYEHVLPLLVSVEQNEEIDGLLLILNTMGGDVEAGLAIAELVSSMKKPTVSLVLGGSHSIGVPLAVSAKRSFIASSATMTIHPVRMSGTVIGSPQTYEYFRKMQDRITEFVCKNSNISKEEFTALMMKTGEIANDVGTIVSGDDAVKFGLIDEKGGLDSALDFLYNEIIKKKGGVNDVDGHRNCTAIDDETNR